jgi:mannose/fructose/N-acetylgalactosamine-specific phosphotransferase system component IIB
VKIVLIRVDDRLVHGQVVYGWTRALGVDLIVVADDKAAKDSFQITLMQMAAPAGVKVDVHSVEDAARLLTGQGDSSAHALVLVRGPEELLRLRQLGVPFDMANVGNVHTGPGRSKLTKGVYANDVELAAWRELAEDGVKLEAQWVPAESRTDLSKLVLKK